MTKLTIHDAPAIIQDTREQEPWVFGHPVRIETMKTGDYTIEGLQGVCVIERKRHGEWVQMMTHERERFERELERARNIPYFHIIIEASAKAVLLGLYDDWPNQTHVSSIRGSMVAWSNRYPTVRIWTPGDATAASAWAEHILKKTWLDHQLGKLLLPGPKQEAA